MCYPFVLPTVLLLAVFSIVPFLWALAMALYQYEAGGTPKYVGFSNFVQWFRDPVFCTSMAHMAFLAVIAVIARCTVPLVLARVIYSLPTERQRHFYRIAFLLPMLFPGPAILLIWASVVYSDTGIINLILGGLGLESLTRGWLSNPSTALIAIAFVGFPFAGGFEILIYYAGFSNIPESVNDAAIIDGAGVLKKFFFVEFPMILSQVRMLVILAIIGASQGFETILILTSSEPMGAGGPGFKTMVPGLWMYINAFLYQNLGYACAIGVFLFLFIMTLTLLNLRFIKSTSQIQEA